MKKNDAVFIIGLVALSILTSFMFTFYGVSIIMSGTANEEPTLFAYVAIAYGLANLAVLSIAWSSRDAWAVTANKLFACCFIGVFVLEMFRSGSSGSLQPTGAIVLLVVLVANWLTIKSVVNRN
jgi:hypothetical protein